MAGSAVAPRGLGPEAVALLVVACVLSGVLAGCLQEADGPRRTTAAIVVVNPSNSSFAVVVPLPPAARGVEVFSGVGGGGGGGTTSLVRILETRFGVVPTAVGQIDVSSRDGGSATLTSNTSAVFVLQTAVRNGTELFPLDAASPGAAFVMVNATSPSNDLSITIVTYRADPGGMSSGQCVFVITSASGTAPPAQEDRFCDALGLYAEPVPLAGNTGFLSCGDNTPTRAFGRGFAIRLSPLDVARLSIRSGEPPCARMRERWTVLQHPQTNPTVNLESF